MPDLLKKEPTGRGKLYNKIEDADVSPETAIFTWKWITRAIKIKDKERFLTHLEAGHFGPHETVAEDNYKLIEGHRAICRFNNGRYGDQPAEVYTREQYADLIAGKPIRTMPVLVRGKVLTKQVSMKTFDSKEFIAVRHYNSDQASILATDRVQLEVKQKTVPWYDLGKGSDEYQSKFIARYRFYNTLYLAEMVLVAKDIASDEELRLASDLPASILSLIDGKLTVTEASFYIARWLAFQEVYDEKDMANPALTFRLHQIILEELMIEHYRDLQRLHGDNIDKPTQDALQTSIKRHQDLMPAELKITAKPSSNGKPADDEPVEEEVDPTPRKNASIDDDPMMTT